MFYGGPKPQKKSVDLKEGCVILKFISLVIYTFRGHIRAYKKGIEMLFEFIYIYTLWFVGVVSVLYR